MNLTIKARLVSSLAALAVGTGEAQNLADSSDGAERKGRTLLEKP